MGKLYPIHSDARFSDCKKYRYTLSREWDKDRRKCVFIMLNPSTADETQDDPTVTRCIHFAGAWGYGGVIVLNLFAMRATNPKELYAGDVAPVGPNNDYWIQWTIANMPRSRHKELPVPMVVCAWGAHGAFMNRGNEVKEKLYDIGIQPHALGLTKYGHPRHPLYLKAELEPFRWL